MLKRRPFSESVIMVIVVVVIAVANVATCQSQSLYLMTDV